MFDKTIGLFLFIPIAFILCLMYYIIGLVILVDEYDLCIYSKLYYYNLTSYIMFLIIKIFIIKSLCFDGAKDYKTYTKHYNLLFHNFIFIFSFGLILWGSIELFGKASKCDYNNTAIWKFGIIKIVFHSNYYS